MMEKIGTNQLDELVSYLTDALGARVMQTFDSDTSEVRQVNSAKNLGLGYLRTGFDVFDVELVWSDWPYRMLSPELPTSLLEAWLHDNGDMRETLQLTEPTYDIIRGDDDTMMVTLNVGLYKERVIREDPRGVILREGKRYSIATPEVWVAEESTVSVEPNA
ncbi:phage tail protein [Edwardsiella tarda]|uniref:phage tail protein n=1 Tax=Edwardsiella tarda TaxID=636 RepID=UPI0024447382|nr:phage tail protein [Edwardsiella tarda]WGE29423.1 phage tail protein [Edwardsiella tarda]